MSDTEPDLGERLAAVRGRIAEAARLAGRDPAELTTVVVTKFHPASLVRRLAELGVRDVGENRHQEARDKAAELADLDLTWHFVGQLQTKKARQARAYARVFHSVDRVRLVDALAGGEHPLDCFVQVDLREDAPGAQVAGARGDARGGAAPDEVEPLAERILAADGLRLRGVMAVAPLGEEPERAFARLRAISERVIRLSPDARAISAGMSHDFPQAIAHGATHLRIGTAITGKRPDRG